MRIVSAKGMTSNQSPKVSGPAGTFAAMHDASIAAKSTG